MPLSAQKIAGLLKQAGLPDGVFNIVNGDKEIVEAICDHSGINAVTFVGSTRVARVVYRRATSNLKRALCLGGAKNHLIVLPDANLAMSAANIAASMSGCAGQRCMRPDACAILACCRRYWTTWPAPPPGRPREDARVTLPAGSPARQT